MDRTDLTDAVRAGDEAAFRTLVERHRRELQVHCYRMVGSFTESEDLVQETFLRAWRSRATAQGTFRAWLYRIATNASLDAIARRPADRQVAVGRGAAVAEVSWLQPYPDALLEGVADREAGPEAQAVDRETIELAFLAAIQHLPPRQRAVLILRDVLGWRANDTAELLESTVASVNSALQRARATVKEHLPRRRDDWSPSREPTAEELAVLESFMEATEKSDLDGFATLLAEHARHTMPPDDLVLEGRDAMIAAWAPVTSGPEAWGEWRCRPIRLNRQLALANYLRRPGEEVFRPCNIDVLRIEDGHVVEVTSFSPDLFAALGLPSEP